MIRFRDFKFRTKLALALVAALLPLVVGEILTVRSMQGSLQKSAELALSNNVRQLYRIVALTHRSGRARHAAGDAQPSPPGREYLAKVFQGTRVGKTGYPYVMDARGTLLLHPLKAGENIIDSRDSSGRAFIKEICRKAVRLKRGAIGTIRYPWRNVEGGEPRSRMKIVKYMHFEPWGWIIAVGAYEDEIYAPVTPATRSALTLFGASLALVVLLTWWMSRLVARPVVRLHRDAQCLAHGRLDCVEPLDDRRDEVGELRNAFGSMAEQINRQKEELEHQVELRTRELNDSREQYRSLVENAVDCIVTADLSGTITFANGEMETLIGMRRSDIVGRKIWEFYRGGIDKARDIMKRIRQEGSIRNYEQQLIANGRSVPIMTSATLIYDAAGEPVGTMGIFTDVTKFKELEEELSRAQVDLAQAHKLRALGDLVAGVAHEVNNPLMASTTMVRVIERNLTADDRKLTSQLQVLKKCNQRITMIVNHLREFSRQTLLEKQRININQPLSNALLISKQQLLNLQIVLEQDLADDLPDVFGDANLLEQVFLDLFANARDAMEGQESDKILTIRSFAMQQLGEPMVTVQVQDTGSGIPEAIQDKIFEPFFTTKPMGMGTGLGLPICYGIIENHEGHIDLTSSADGGTTFTIRIPAMAPRLAGSADEDRADESQDPTH